jgi:hypothetical protein
MSDAKSASYLNLEVSAAGVVERNGRQRLAHVPLDGIDSVEFAHGFVAERIPLQLIFGALLLGAGPWMGLRFFDNGGPRSARLLLAWLFITVFGVAVLIGSLRRGHYLRVTRRGDTRKLTVRGPFDATAAATFLAELRHMIHRV